MAVIFLNLYLRVRKPNLLVLHFFMKNEINKLIFNIFCSNLQVMSFGIFCNKLFKKIAASLNNGLNPLAKPPAGLGHCVPQEVGHDLRDLRLQGGGSVVGTPVDISLANAPKHNSPGGCSLGCWEAIHPLTRTLEDWPHTTPGSLSRCVQARHPAGTCNDFHWPLCLSRV